MAKAPEQTAMEFIKAFQDYLFSQPSKPSKATVKNYAADVRRFVRWFEQRFKEEFNPTKVTSQLVLEFKRDQTISPSTSIRLWSPSSAKSVERYMSSLRKFFTFLLSTDIISSHPFEVIDEANHAQVKTDPWQIVRFKNFLFIQKASEITIKNYITDLQQFINWLTIAMSGNDHYDLKEKNLFTQVTPFLLAEYKNRLLTDAKAAPTTVNRKLSSLRKYIVWAQSQGILKAFEAELLPTNIQEKKGLLRDNPITETVQNTSPHSNTTILGVTKLSAETKRTPEKEVEADSNAESRATYSSFAPLRLFQRLQRMGTVVFDTAIVLPVFTTADTFQYLLWTLKGHPVFIPEHQKKSSSQFAKMLKGNALLQKVTPKKPKLIGSLSKSFYAPLAISLKHAPFHKKAWFHIRHTRPAWYKAYHSYAVVHYVHAAILIICMSAAGFGVAQAVSDVDRSPITIASLPQGPPRLLSFKGKLTRSDSTPLTANTHLRFSLYNDSTASGSSMLWEEVQDVLPDETGTFSTVLGQVRSIPQSLFEENARLYIGMTVEANPELTPRKQIPTEVLAATADSLQGLRPISDPQAGQKNAVLTLDSSGNMVIGGKANPSFIATGGVFTLSGQTVLLTTTPGSNSDIQLAPDGLGRIDVQKPLHNTSNNITSSGIPGAVAIEDTVAISASDSGRSALYINQNSTGPLISASVSGIAKFTLENTGAATFGDSLMLYGNSLNSTQTSFNLLTTSPINLAIGTSATALSLGGSGGIAVINNSQTVISGNLNVNGTTGLTFGNAAAGINFSGQGTHLITASSGSLQLGAMTLTGTTSLAQNVSILPSVTDGENNLGSATNPFDNLYVNNIISPSTMNGGYWQSQNGVLAPQNISQGLLLGSTASASAVWQVFASGANAGTASSSGNLSFSANTAINQLNGGSLSFRTSPGGDAGLATQMTLSNNGYLGVGTTTPQYRIDLPNTAGPEGQGRATAWVTYSSRRFKEDITAITNPLDKISRLQGVYFNWKQEYGGTRDIGFIAEEVGQVLPELVEYEADGVNAKSLKYDRITALAIEGIKAQQDEITRIDALVGSLAFSSSTSFHIIETTGNNFLVQSDTGKQIKTTGAFEKAFIGVLNTGKTIAKTIETTNLIGSTGIMDFMRITRVNSDYIETTDMTILGTMKAKKSTILSLGVDTIESTEADNALSLRVGKTNLLVYGKTQGNNLVVASIDTSGNATFAGRVTAKNATVTDTLSAGKLIAEQLDLSETGLLALASRLTPYLHSENNQNISQNINISPYTTPATDDTEDPSASSSADANVQELTDGGVVTTYDAFASDSASFSLVPPTIPYTSGGAVPIGTPLPSGAGVVVADLSVAGMINIGGNFVLNENAIDVVGADLQIQPLRSGGVSFLAGLISINPSGDLAVQGTALFARDVTVKGTLATSILSPIAEQDLIVRLGSTTTRQQEFVVQNATGEAQLRIKNTGDITSEGEAQFASLLSKSLTILRGSQADASPVQTIASASAGTALILPGQTQRTIITPFVTAKSLVYMTPTSDTQGYVPYIARQTTEDPTRSTQGSFTIEISEPVTKPIKINWWIVN